jgi:PAS domain S-box-containing protein
MWFATPAGLSSFSNGQWRTYTTVDGLPSPEVNCLFEDSSGTLWSGTSAGLASFASGHFQVPTESPDVLREQILGMADDKSGRLWIAASHHVLRVPRDKLLSGVVKAVDVHEYDQADGLESTEGVKRSRSVVSDSAGRIWLSLSSGLSVVNPSQINDNSVPALPHIEAITADNNTANLDTSVKIPPSPRRITFEYTGLSLAVPERISFRYFLEGFDNNWSQPVAAREAVYTNLGPGPYRFRLVASNSEGLWNGPETAIAFNVAPAYYQTYWFRLLCVAALLAFLWGVHRLRVQQLRREERKLRQAIETIPAMAWIAGPDGAAEFVNRRVIEYTGLSHLGKVGEIGKIAVHPDDRDRIVRRWDASIASGEPFEEEMRVLRSDGEYWWFLSRRVPLRDKRGKVVNGTVRRSTLKIASVRNSYKQNLHTPIGSADSENWSPPSRTNSHSPSRPQPIMQGIFAMASARPARFGAGSQRDGKHRRGGHLCLGNHQPPAIVVQENSSTSRVGRRGRDHPGNGHAAAGRSQRACRFDSYGPYRRSSQNHGRPGATAAGTDEPHAQWYRGDEGDRRTAYGQDGTRRGQSSADLSQRHRSRIAARKKRTRSSMPSSPRNLKAAAWGWRSAVP